MISKYRIQALSAERNVSDIGCTICFLFGYIFLDLLLYLIEVPESSSRSNKKRLFLDRETTFFIGQTIGSSRGG
jgi:hypothetical protein